MGELREKDLAGLVPVDSYIPFHRPSLGKEEEDAVVEVLRSGWITRGEITSAFENEFATHVGAAYAVGLNSCTAALHLALLAAGVGPGDEVITSPFTFAATANAVVHSGATPVFADIDPDTLNVDPGEIERKVNESTKAVIPVHFGGAPCDMDRIGKIADEHGLTVIEDAAHALGASYRGRRIGSISDLTAFSFYATKNITTGEGGMLTTDDEALAEKTRVLSLHGMSADAWKRYSRKGHSYYEVVQPGFKYNMFDIQAALGRVQLKKDIAMMRRRAEIAAIYEESLGGCDLLRHLKTRPDDIHAHHLHVVVLSLDGLQLTRDQVAQAMEDLNIGVSVHFHSLHLHPYYRDRYRIEREDFPLSLNASESSLSLPIYPAMSDAEASAVAGTLKSLLERFAA